VILNDSDTIRIGYSQNAVFIAGIYNAAVIGSPVYIDTNTSRLGLLSSSERFKDAIEAMGNASEALLALRPVTFRYKEGIDPNRTAQFGLVAEDVEKVNPDLVVRDKEGKPYTVRYDAVNAMLLNEFLKEHRKVEQLTKDFESKLAEQQKKIEALTTGLQKVTARLEIDTNVRNVAVAAP
jgi:trimeric autotransporter adhesin